MKYNFTLMTVKGVPVQFNISVLLLLVILPMMYSLSILKIIVASVFYLGVIIIHELGHAFIARRHGLKVYSIEISIAHGLCEYERPENKLTEIYVAWGGVLAQLILFITAIAVVYLLSNTLSPNIREVVVQPMVMIFLVVNMFILVFNLLPIRPLDGYTAWQIIPCKLGEIAARNKKRKEERVRSKSRQKRKNLGLKIVSRKDDHE